MLKIQLDSWHGQAKRLSWIETIVKESGSREGFFICGLSCFKGFYVVKSMENPWKTKDFMGLLWDFYGIMMI